MTQSVIVETIKLQLEKLNIQIKREYKTGDDSLFLRLKGKFCLDIYPNGEIVLLERNGEKTYYSEFAHDEINILFERLYEN